MYSVQVQGMEILNSLTVLCVRGGTSPFHAPLLNYGNVVRLALYSVTPAAIFLDQPLLGTIPLAVRAFC